MNRQIVRAFVVLALLPNVLLGFVAAAAHTPRALVNLDYVAVFALDAFVRRGVTVVLMAIALLLDIAFTVAPAFNFGPSEVVQAVAEIRNLSGRTIVVAVTVIGLIALAALGIVLLRGRRVERSGGPRQLAVALVFTVLVLGVDILNGSNAFTWRPRRLLATDVSESMLVTRYSAPGTLPPTGKAMAATDGVRAEIARATELGRWEGPTKIVVIVVEAMGAPRGASVGTLFSALAADSVSRRYETRTGTIPAFGSTTTGEIRALCGVARNHLSLLSPQADVRCLPHELRPFGFEAVALHGYNGSLFQRREWYPRVGFGRMLFREELRANARLPECGAVFHGVCDSTMARVVRAELKRAPGKRELIYWLTLSSHFPIDPRTGGSGAACESLGRFGKEREICALWNALWPALQGIAGLAADTTLPPAWYIIAGDHAPPQLFSDTTLWLQRRVPFMELRPRVR
ncbi:MAG: sulfatase-like hydrolase/transferase [Gemmatimonadaceae bacterium]